MSKKTLYVTQPFLPPLEEFMPYLQEIWRTKVVTNNGPFHQLLEEKLAECLGVENVVLFSNGTMALLAGLRALQIEGEVITTPYSFVATAHSLLWNNNRPIFVDVDPDTLNIDTRKIEDAITEKTSAILPVHCYGNPCDVEKLSAIAENYNLKLIYDAAHAFGVNCHGQSILNYGDASILSFHATKVFSTFEGGAVICKSKELRDRLNELKNFGFHDEVTVGHVGINAKMNEVSAAFGLLQLDYIDAAIASRSEVDKLYRKVLGSVKGIEFPVRSPDATENFSYFPILVNEEFPVNRDCLYGFLKDNNVFARRYFFPLISEMPMYQSIPSSAPSNLSVALKKSKQVICLPIYPAMTPEDVGVVCDVILEKAHG